MKRIAFALVACLAFATSARADIYDSGALGFTWTSTTAAPLVHNFALPDALSINSITIEMSHTWGNDMNIQVAGPGGSFDIMSAQVSTTASGNFDIGAVAASGALANVGSYVFTGAGATNWISPFSAAGNYNAESFSGGFHAAGAWSLTVSDTIAGDDGSVNRIIIDYTPNAIPEPSSALALAGLAAFGLIRRRVRA